MKKTLLLIGTLVTVAVHAQLSLVPMPAEVKMKKGKFSLSASTVLLTRNGADNAAADFFNAALKKKYGFTLKKVKTATADFIELTTLQSLLPGKDGAYRLNSMERKIII